MPRPAPSRQTGRGADLLRQIVRQLQSIPRAEGSGASNATRKPTTSSAKLIKQNPKNADYRVRWGYLFLERFNNEEAHGCSTRRSKIDKNNAPAYLGIAQVESEGFSKHAVEAAQKAADLDPKLYEAHELLAYLALEDNDEDTAAKQADMALAISPEALDAMAIHLPHRFPARQKRHALDGSHPQNQSRLRRSLLHRRPFLRHQPPL